MNQDLERSKVPEVTLVFWIIKIRPRRWARPAATRSPCRWTGLSRRHGDLPRRSSSSLVAAQIARRRFHPFALLGDDRRHDHGRHHHGRLRRPLARHRLRRRRRRCCSCLLLAALGLWYCRAGIDLGRHGDARRGSRCSTGSRSLFSQTLGTALGDWMADTGGLGYAAARWCSRAALAVIARALLLDDVSRVAAVLGGLHPDAAAGRHGRRLPRQAARQWRPRVQPVLCVGQSLPASSLPAWRCFHNAPASIQVQGASRNQQRADVLTSSALVPQLGRPNPVVDSPQLQAFGQDRLAP